MFQKKAQLPKKTQSSSQNPPKTKKQPPKSTKNHQTPCTCGLVPVAFCRAPGSGNFGTMSLASFGAAQVSARFSRRPSPGPEPEPSAALRKGSTSRFRVEKSSADQRTRGVTWQKNQEDSYSMNCLNCANYTNYVYMKEIIITQTSFFFNVFFMYTYAVVMMYLLSVFTIVYSIHWF